MHAPFFIYTYMHTCIYVCVCTVPAYLHVVCNADIFIILTCVYIHFCVHICIYMVCIRFVILTLSIDHNYMVQLKDT